MYGAMHVFCRNFLHISMGEIQIQPSIFLEMKMKIHKNTHIALGFVANFYTSLHFTSKNFCINNQIVKRGGIRVALYMLPGYFL